MSFMKPTDRYARIICTLGPASDTLEMLAKMAKRGMNIARINCSHGNQRQHQQLIDLVRQVNKKYHYQLKILLDLEGYRIRVGNLPRNLVLKNNGIVYMGREMSSKGSIPIDYEDRKSTRLNSSH